MRLNFFSLSNLTLIVALALSGVAAYYSIIGLTAIFAGAVIPIVVMGIILEIAKITTTVWLRTFWKQCGWLMKSYLVPAVIVLALITSMGIFGFLSKSHLDQGVPTGDVAAKVSLLDEKIKTQRENIVSSRAALAQMDLQVNNVITKGDTERSAERSVQIRRQQAPERAKLQKEIEVANTTIGKLNEERAPISSQLRKVEAEVGPIKYIAALIYGDNPDQNILEKAVRWVIILLVLVFDPLAIALILAANQSKYWKIERPEEEVEIGPKPDPIPAPEPILTDDQVFQAIVESATPIEEKPLSELHPYLNNAPATFRNDGPIQVAPPQETPGAEVVEEEAIEFPKMEIELKVPELEITHNDIQFEKTPDDIQTEGVTVEVIDTKHSQDEYVVYQGKHMARRVLHDMRPDLMLTVDSTHPIDTNFGSKFPDTAMRGDVFVRVDVLPNRVYKFDGVKWIMLNKDTTTVYLQDPAYIQHLIGKIDSGEYDVDFLSQEEKQQIEEYLQKPSQ
jgi:hypothetical protein